jgi:hypothetical protein
MVCLFLMHFVFGLTVAFLLCIHDIQSSGRSIILTGGGFVIFSSVSRQILGYCLKLGYGVFFPHLSFILHYCVTIPPCIVWRILIARGLKSGVIVLLLYNFILLLFMFLYHLFPFNIQFFGHNNSNSLPSAVHAIH